MTSPSTPTVGQCLHRAVELADVSDSPRLDLELLLAHLLERDRTWLYTWPEASLSTEQLAEFERLLARRANGEPIAHLTGRRDFWTLSLQVNSSTLIPRPDTERLLELALERCQVEPGARALDLGTGTGALALAFASERPVWQVTGLDCSPEAVALAERNRTQLGIANARFLQSDWFDRLPTGAHFELVMANPPYIDPDDPHLNEGDVRFEPRSALVAQNQGLADIEHIARQAPAFLAPGGWLLLEHGWQQADAVRGTLRDRGFESVASYRDLGDRERVTLGRWGEPDNNL